MRVLGVTIRSDLRMTTHVDNVLTSCSSSMYALRVLRSHGLPPSALHEVTKMTTIAHLMYATPAWWGYTSAGERDRIEQLMSVCSSFLTTSCVVTKTLSVALLLYPGLGLALSESEQWRSCS